MILVSGCTTSTVESRKQERYGAYSSLAPEQRTLVDGGKIKVGVTEDAVYIALGKPVEVLQQETQAGASTVWLYGGTRLREHRYWAYRSWGHRSRYYSEPYMAFDYSSEPYVRLEVVFEKGLVREWRTLPVPR